VCAEAGAWVFLFVCEQQRLEQVCRSGEDTAWSVGATGAAPGALTHMTPGDSCAGGDSCRIGDTRRQSASA
jgi:hypothetical protein